MARSREVEALRLSLTLLLLCPTGRASAGPPLISDDPYTVGPGRVELILAASGLGDTQIRVVDGPQLDLTLGLLSGLDLTVVGSPSFVREQGMADTTDGNFSGGFKWQPLESQVVNASLSPAMGFSALTTDQWAILLPAQLEISIGRLAVGVDGGYGFVARASNQWHASLYASLLATERVTVLTEFWSARSPATEHVDTGSGLAVDWATSWGFNLLAMAGTGISSSDAGRVEWTAYLGLQWRFELWQPASGPDDDDLALALRRVRSSHGRKD